MSVIHFCLSIACLTLNKEERADLFVETQNSEGGGQGGITCGAIDEPRKSSKVIDERVIINFCDKNVVNARFRDKNGGFIF